MTKKNSAIDKILGDVSKTSATKQILLGASSGWLTGCLAMKVSRVAAFSLGGGILLLQVANEKGYIKINWDKINKQIDKVADKNELAGYSANWMDRLENYVDKKADEVEGVVKDRQKAAKRWYSKFTGQNNKLKEIHVFLISFVAGVAIDDTVPVVKPKKKVKFKSDDEVIVKPKKRKVTWTAAQPEDNSTGNQNNELAREEPAVIEEEPHEHVDESPAHDTVDWPQTDLRTLVQKMEQALPENDSLAFQTRVDKLNWDDISFDKYTGDDCKKTWTLIQKRIRRFRVLNELLQDAKEWISKPWTNFYRGPKSNRHPDMPKKPLSGYMLYYVRKKEKFLSQYPGLEMTEVSKRMAQLYKNFPTEKREKYTQLAAAERKVYEEKLEEFYRLHPDEPRFSERTLHTKAVETGPKKPSAPFAFFYREQLKNFYSESENDRNTFKEQCRDQWKNMSDKRKIVWIDRALEEEDKYQEELKNYIVQNPNFPTTPFKSVVTKEERAIKERLAGKPIKPPNSAYSLFSQIMLKSDEIKKVDPKGRMKALADQWKSCSEEEKKIYQEHAEQLMAQYKLDFAMYLESLPESKRQEELQNNLPKRKKKVEETKSKTDESKSETEKSKSETEKSKSDEKRNKVIEENATEENITDADKPNNDKNAPENTTVVENTADIENTTVAEDITIAKSTTVGENTTVEKKNNTKVEVTVNENDVEAVEKAVFQKADKHKTGRKKHKTDKKKKKKDKVSHPERIEPTSKQLSLMQMFEAQPAHPPESGFTLFSKRYHGRAPVKNAWRHLSKLERSEYEAEVVMLKQKYIKDYEAFLKSLTKEHLTAFSKMNRELSRERQRLESFSDDDYEQKRNDIEVDHLFNILEKVGDIKTTQINRLKESVDFSLLDVDKFLKEALSICDIVSSLEHNYQEDSATDLARNSRKVEWERFIDNLFCLQIKMKSILKTSSVLLLPSEKLLEHIKLLQRNDEQRTPHVNNSLITEEDCKFLKSLELDDVEFTLSNDIPTEDENNASSKDITTEEEKQCLNSGDVLRLFERLQKENNNNTNKIYLHELLLGSAIILPKNLEIPRNEELDMRCSLLKVQQENREYKAITKNIDNVRKPHPEDTIAYQSK
ncbi:hypothetical protein FQA39_LY04802 [Lamprigera yunnana]|nr:hypothetical protein FQA39_LY04802 [Lamprigera yunnana]